MNWPLFLDLAPVAVEKADVLLLPLPYEVTVSYGGGTGNGPRAIWQASRQVELWDEQLRVDLASLGWQTAEVVTPRGMEMASDYLARVEQTARGLHRHADRGQKQKKPLVVGVGGEHSLTPALVCAAHGGDDLTGVTVVQFDAHADLRDIYEGKTYSHACAMRRLVERSARVIAIGIRSVEQEEAEFADDCELVKTFPARLLSGDLLPGETNAEQELLETLRNLTGEIYLTIDIDALEVSLCPATGTPQPGGLRWWQAVRYLHALLVENPNGKLIGFDLVETVPQEGTQVNEFTAALLIAKVAAMYAVRDRE